MGLILKKNYIVIFSVTFFFILLSCKKTKEQETNFTISGALKNIETPYFLIASENPSPMHIDTVLVDSKGNFKYKGKTNNLQIVSLYFNEKPWSASVFIDKGWDVHIEGDINRPDLIRVDGGYINDDLTAFKKHNAELLNKKAEIILVDTDSLGSETRQTKLMELKNIDFELTNRARHYIEKNPDKISSVILIQDFFKNNSSLQTLDDLLGLLTGEAASYQLTEELKVYSQQVKESSVGAKAPIFRIADGKKLLTLKDYERKYLYLFFGDCSGDFCDKTLIELQKIYSSLNKNNIQFLSVFINVPPKFSYNKPLSFPVIFDKEGWASQIVKDYNVQEVPYGILISPESKIIQRKLYPEELVEVMDSIKVQN